MHLKIVPLRYAIANCFVLAISLLFIGNAKAADYVWRGGSGGSLTDAANWNPSPAGEFTSADKLIVESSAEIIVPKSVAVGEIYLFTSDNVSFSSGEGVVLNVGRITNSGTGTATFGCPVNFSSTYYVTANGAVKFPGGVKATYPDSALRTTSASANTLKLYGNFEFTADWKVNNIGNNDNFPWVIASGSVVRSSKAFTGEQSGLARILRIEDGGSAYFASMIIGYNQGEIDVDGYLEISGKLCCSTGKHMKLGRSGNIGTIKANRFEKDLGNACYVYVPKLIVGAGGFGSVYNSWMWIIDTNTTIVAAENFEFFSPGLHPTNPVEWGIIINEHKTLTIDVPEGKRVVLGIGITSNETGDYAGGAIRKIGAGTLVMSDTYGGDIGYAKVYGQGTFVDEGEMIVEGNNSLGNGIVNIAAGARVELKGNIVVSNTFEGAGTLVLGNGVTMECGNFTSMAGTIEFASPNAVVTVKTTDTSAFAFLTNLKSGSLANFSTSSGTLCMIGGALVVNADAPAGAYVWNGANGSDWSRADSWLVNGVVPESSPTADSVVFFRNDDALVVGGSSTMKVKEIRTVSGALLEFVCPVEFADTYRVFNAARAPRFTGGAKAKYADSELTNANNMSHVLSGNITFTEDWAVPVQPFRNPFVVSSGTILRGKTLSGVAYEPAKPVLRFDEGSVSTFDVVKIHDKLDFHMNGGRLVSIGDIEIGGSNSSQDVGCYKFLHTNLGTIEANGLYKYITGYGNVYLYAPNYLIGSGGFGMRHKDYAFILQRDVTLTAKDNFTIYKPEEGLKDNDWGIKFNGNTFTVDTVGHTVVFDSNIHNTAGTFIKKGAGEVVMQGGNKQHQGGTIVQGGTLSLNMLNGTGSGVTTVEDGAKLYFKGSVAYHAYPVVVKSGAVLETEKSVDFSSELVLESGAILAPKQNSYINIVGSLSLPVAGKVVVDMKSYNFANGVGLPLLVGVGEDMAAKFDANLPEGVSGSFSVSDGVLVFTATSGGVAVSSLFWHPQGESVWSEEVVAWTNANGQHTAFVPYSRAVISNGATISVPRDITTGEMLVSSDGDVALNGSGKIGGLDSIVKDGKGVFTFNTIGGLDSQKVIVSNGVFKVGENLTGGNALGSASDLSPIVVAPGGTLDVNYNNEDDASDHERSAVTHDKLIRISGDGFNGQGAIVNNANKSYETINDLVLDDDASLGGSVRFDIRGGSSGYARNKSSIRGEGKDLLIKNTGGIGFIETDLALGSITVTNGATIMIEGNVTGHLDNGLRLVDGGSVRLYGSTFPAGLTLNSVFGDNKIYSGAGTSNVNGPVVISEGATLTQTGGNIFFNGKVDGTLSISGGNMYLTAGVLNKGLKVNGAKGGERIYMRESGIFSDADITSKAFGVADVANTTVDVAFNDSKLDIAEFYLGWGGVASGRCTIGPGTTLETGKIAIGDTGTSTDSTIKSSFTVDGGTVNHTGDHFFIAYNGPNAEFVLDSGEVTVEKAVIRVRANNAKLGGYNKSRFIQNGGVFNYSGTGFTANWEDNTDDGMIVLKGGEFNAFSNWSIPCFIPMVFREGSEGGWTLNQAEGTTATWTTALYGCGDVTLNGAGALDVSKEIKGAVGGKWTVGDGFTASLRGASSFLGGLALGDGASVTVDVATDRSSVFTARDFSGNLGSDDCITHRFNKAVGGTTRSTITHDETLLFTKYNTADRPFGNLNFQSAFAVGQFYVPEEAAGEWQFKGYCDDWSVLDIDGERVLATEMCKTAEATINLSAGWHSFRHLIIDNSGGFGSGEKYGTLGYKYAGMSDFAGFNVKNIKMRPGADMGDGNNPNTVVWSHFKGDSSTVTADTFKNDFEWDFRSITNTLDMIQWKGRTSEYMNTYTVNRYEGWFFVTDENADKDWTFRTQYDDRAKIWIDGIDSGLEGKDLVSPTWTINLSKGWHRFRIQTADFTGDAGPWNTALAAVSYQVGNGAETQFSEKTLRLSVCPDGYIQGLVELGSNSQLSNAATENSAVVYGDLRLADGAKGAVVSGPFKFEGSVIDYGTIAQNTRSLEDLIKYENPAADYLANVGKIKVTYTSEPVYSRLKIGPAGGFDLTTTQEKIEVMCAGERCRVRTVIENGDLYLRFHRGTVIILR